MASTRFETNELASARASIWDEKPQLQKLVSIAPTILYVFNLRTYENDFVNASLGAAMGYSVEEIAAMGAEFMPRICHPEDLSKLQSYFHNFQQMRDGDVSQSEYRMRHRKGHWCWMLSNDRVFSRNANGAVENLIGVATDITALKTAEETAIAERRAAMAANDELRSFAYSISHDMKAPTNTLKLLLSELKAENQEHLNDDSRELVDMSLGMVDKMQSLVEDVLGYTRIIGSEAVFEPVALAPMVAELQQSLAADIRAAGARILLDDLPTVRGNAVQLRVYFQNIISNALKYRSPDQDLLVRIECNENLDDGRLCISVADNGMGISPNNQERIFGMFKRLHLESEIAGTGLGLALCRRVALNHGGEVNLRSAVGEGSTFTVDLARA